MPKPQQPLLNDETIVLRAPTQAWSAADGSMGSKPIHGVYFGDVRLVSRHALTVNGSPVEHIATHFDGPSTVVFVGLLRGLDAVNDPDVRLELRRTVGVAGIEETITIQSRLPHPLEMELRIALETDAVAMDSLKAGKSVPSTGASAVFDPRAGRRRAHLGAPGARPWQCRRGMVGGVRGRARGRPGRRDGHPLERASAHRRRPASTAG